MTEELPSNDAGRVIEKTGTAGGQITRPRMTQDEIAKEAQRIIDDSIRRNAPLEVAIVGILASVAAVGIFLLVNGTAERRWELLASGSSCAFAVGWPVARLVGMWKFNHALKSLPAIIRMSDTKSRQELLFRFVDRLIDKL